MAIAVFSSIDSRTQFDGGLRYKSQTSAARAAKVGSYLRVSQPRTR